jgi:signal peptidase II
MNKTKQIILTLVIANSVWVIDLIIKQLIITQLHQPIIFTSWLKIISATNTGIAFGIDFSGPMMIITNLILFIALIYYLFQKLDLTIVLSRITIGLLIGGAIGNLIDRIFYGHVIDYLSIGSFPVFNLADSCITVSVFIILLFYDKIRKANKN